MRKSKSHICNLMEAFKIVHSVLYTSNRCINNAGAFWLCLFRHCFFAFSKKKGIQTTSSNTALKDLFFLPIFAILQKVSVRSFKISTLSNGVNCIASFTYMCMYCWFKIESFHMYIVVKSYLCSFLKFNTRHFDCTYKHKLYYLFD